MHFLLLSADGPTERIYSHFELASKPTSWAALFFVVLLGLLLFLVARLYRSEGGALKGWSRSLLGFFRAAVLLGICFLLLEPILARDIQRKLDTYVVLLVDESASMKLKDRNIEEGALKSLEKAAGFKGIEEFRKRTRAELVEQVLKNKDLKILEKLLERTKLKVYYFSSEVREETIKGAEGRAGKAPLELPPIAADGRSTDIEKALRQALNESQGPVAAVVVFTDGQSNAGESPLAVVQQAVDRQVPIYCVGVGDPLPPKNVWVAEVLNREIVFKDDPVPVRARIEHEGLGGQTLEATLFLARRGSETAPSEIGKEKVTFPAEGKGVDVAFRLLPTEIGEFVLTVKVEAVAGEIQDEDNARSSALKVVDEKAQVLVVAGVPSREYQFLRNMLQRDKTMAYSCWLQSADRDYQQDGTKRLTALPASEEDLFQYDVIVLIDPDLNAVDPAFVENIKKFVDEHGGGLCYVAGPTYSVETLKGTHRDILQGILPVEPDLDASAHGVFRTERAMEVTPEGFEHSILRMDEDEGRNREIYNALPGVYWYLPVGRPKPGAVVLMQDPNPADGPGARPLLATHIYGSGRVVFSAFDSIWRWRKAGERYFDQYWTQEVRYLLEGKLQGGRKKVEVGTDRDRYSLGEKVRVSVRLYDEKFKKLVVPRVQGWQGPSGEKGEGFEILPLADQEGRYEGEFIPGRTGLLTIRVEPPPETGGGTDAVKDIEVEQPTIELEKPTLNTPLLMELGKATGGGYYWLGDAGKVTDPIKAKQVTLVVPTTPLSLWDNWLSLSILAGLLILEWGLRKYFNLS